MANRPPTIRSTTPTTVLNGKSGKASNPKIPNPCTKHPTPTNELLRSMNACAGTISTGGMFGITGGAGDTKIGGPVSGVFGTKYVFVLHVGHSETCPTISSGNSMDWPQLGHSVLRSGMAHRTQFEVAEQCCGGRVQGHAMNWWLRIPKDVRGGIIAVLIADRKSTRLNSSH